MAWVSDSLALEWLILGIKTKGCSLSWVPLLGCDSVAWETLSLGPLADALIYIYANIQYYRLLRNKATLGIRHVLKDFSVHAISDIPLKHGQLIRQNAS